MMEKLSAQQSINIQIIDFKIENAGSKIIFDSKKNFTK